MNEEFKVVMADGEKAKEILENLNRISNVISENRLGQIFLNQGLKVSLGES